MKPEGRKTVRFPGKRDAHPKKGYVNWWENIGDCISRNTRKQNNKKDIESELSGSIYKYNTMDKIMFSWKPITEIPTEHYANNDALSPLYLVRCGEKDGVSILGYSHYSFATKQWMDCFEATASGIHKVTEWTDIKL